jgi:hypothetical protein
MWQCISVPICGGIWEGIRLQGLKLSAFISANYFLSSVTAAPFVLAMMMADMVV